MNLRIITILLCCYITAVSCTSPKERRYNEQTEKQDILAIKKEMSDADYKIFITILEKSKIQDKQIKQKTYVRIFEEGKRRIEKDLAEEKEELAEAQRALKKKKNLEIICSGKWDITYIKITGSVTVNDLSIDTSTQEIHPEINENWIVFNVDENYTTMEQGSEIEKNTWEYYEDQIVLRTPEKEFNRNVFRNLKIQSITNDEIIVLENEKIYMMDGEANIKTYTTLKRH